MRLRAHAREALRAQGQPRGTPHALGVRPGPTPCKAAAPRTAWRHGARIPDASGATGERIVALRGPHAVQLVH